MYDSPNVAELLGALRDYLDEQVIPAVKHDRKLNYQTHVALNVLRIIERELEAGKGHIQAEWLRLDHVQNSSKPFPENDLVKAEYELKERNRKLCEEISAGRYDYMPQRAALYEHLLTTTRIQLEIANPEFLADLAAEDQKKPMPT